MKRLLCFVLAAAAALTMAGCSSIFDREYYVVEAYEAPAEPAEAEEDAAAAITNYASLRRAIVRLVSEHTESAQLQIQNYDGNISQDISTACWEVKSSTALGAFAVDYISYDLKRIVSYYQAELHITYKRAAWQVDAIEKASNASALSAKITEALQQDETYVVLEINAAAVTGETVREAASDAYYADPLTCPVLPQVETGLFPESGVDRILDIGIDYGLDGETLALRRTELGQALAALLAEPEEEAGAAPGETEAEEPADETDGDVTEGEADEAASEEPAPPGEAERYSALCDALCGVCAVSPDGGSTAWDALTRGTADSEGAAMAFEALCRASGLDCVIVIGRMGGETHYWNIVSVDGRYCHLDVSARDGETPVFLLSDEALLSLGYWWDNSEYPACPAAEQEEALENTEKPSGEPS